MAFTEILVIDTNTKCLGHAPYLKNRGVTTVGRYYGVQTSYRDIIDRDEAKHLTQNGIRIFTVFEVAGNASDLDLSKGTDHASLALEQAKAIKQPEGSAIYFAVEGLPNGYKSNDLANVQAYFADIKAKIAGKYAIGVYGDGLVCEKLLQGYCKYAWLAAASTSFEGTCKFFGGKNPAWHLAQVGPLDLNWADPSGGNISVDIDLHNPRLLNGDIGAFEVPLSP